MFLLYYVENSVSPKITKNKIKKQLKKKYKEKKGKSTHLETSQRKDLYWQ